MAEFVLHSHKELDRGVYSTNEWIQLIKQIHSKGFCSTLSLTPTDVFDNEYQTSKNAHHCVGPTLEFASVGKMSDDKSWGNAGWLCTFIKSKTEMFSFRPTSGPIQHAEVSIYTGVHIVESNCICSLDQLMPALQVFLTEQTYRAGDIWLEFNDVFMTHEIYENYRGGGLKKR